VIVLSIIRDCLDALLHPSARYDALTRARHRAFMAPRLLGSLVALAAFPIYLAMRGAPTALEVAASPKAGTWRDLVLSDAAGRAREFDPRKFLKPAMDAMRELCRERFEQFGTAGHASQIKVVPMSEMARRYRAGELDPRVDARESVAA